MINVVFISGVIEKIRKEKNICVITLKVPKQQNIKSYYYIDTLVSNIFIKLPSLKIEIGKLLAIKGHLETVDSIKENIILKADEIKFVSK